MSDGTVVSDSYCSAAKPTTVQICNDDSGCAAVWDTHVWSSCSNTCGTGVRTRTVLCMIMQTSTVMPDSACAGPKPATSEACTGVACAPTCTVSASPQTNQWVRFTLASQYTSTCESKVDNGAWGDITATWGCNVNNVQDAGQWPAGPHVVYIRVTGTYGIGTCQTPTFTVLPQPLCTLFVTAIGSGLVQVTMSSSDESSCNWSDNGVAQGSIPWGCDFESQQAGPFSLGTHTIEAQVAGNGGNSTCSATLSVY